MVLICLAKVHKQKPCQPIASPAILCLKSAFRTSRKPRGICNFRDLHSHIICMSLKFFMSFMGLWIKVETPVWRDPW